MIKSYSEQRITLREQISNQVPANLLARVDAHAETLTDLGREAVDVGAIAPGFTLTDTAGAKFDLATARTAGPVVLSFYRGGWCPYCNLELRTLQAALPEFRARGARLVAVAPESPDDSSSTAQRNALEFDVLTDPGNEIADAYGLVFTIAEDIRDAFVTAGTDLSGTGWQLPITATYVIGTDGRITYAFRNGDFRERAEVSDILAALDG
ncbi:AhpC/TSA family protein [Nocardia sp. NBC_00565]|uniref:peroxiredoxin-like family protein n=1 Tax=Nocardia sp. NBC_00565 TaxID=2975993 RepID=UPI002E8074C5|nr:peroxiredoxin-like family protein [Nocardia sp. NBC_00565]WUC04319.1 AhpC/TSA family protein [Nocardia sp. NBC_00565]